MLLGSWEARLEYRDTLSRSEAFKPFATLDMFGGSPRTNEYKMSSSDGSNVLTKQAILKALEVDEAVLGLTYKGTRFEDVCLRPYLGGACTVDSAMYRLGLGREEVEALSQEELQVKHAHIDAVQLSHPEQDECGPVLRVTDQRRPRV